jgi:ABC-type nitrate/sulfonate/bicarbonate transport system substrate-binding protein
MKMKLAVPDFVSPSYFPAVAAVELGFFNAEGLDVEFQHLFPVDAAYRALRDGTVDFVGGSAHAALAAFPEWEGVQLLCAQAQGMYWFLVMRADLGARRGDLSCVKGRRIGAAPWVDMGLRAMLEDGGIDIERDKVSIAPVPGAKGPGVNFGLMAAQRLQEGQIDGFWANGMAAEVAVRSGAGTLVIDARRGDGPKTAFGFTFSAVAAADRLLQERPEVGAAAQRAIARVHTALREEPQRAADVGRRIFPPDQAALIAELVRRDGPYYDSAITPAAVTSLNAFARRMGILESDPPHSQVVWAES